MAGSGAHFRDLIKTHTAGVGGSKTFEFNVENDGATVYLDRLSGTGKYNVEIFNKLPNGVTNELVYRDNQISDFPHSRSLFVNQIILVRVTWATDADFAVLVSPRSAAAISELKFEVDRAQAWATSNLQLRIVDTLEAIADNQRIMIKHLEYITKLELDH
jgi:hypothetical protein